MLQVKNGQVVNTEGHPVRLRGTCVGGWMNMENFINGYSGTEHGLRAVMAEVLGPGKAQFFFDRMLDYFLAEDDIAFMKANGATVVRLSINYRHFERDDAPFEYLESGFERLDRALGWCAKHDLYAILDLHAVPGWQNNDWHSDNATRQSLFWSTKHFQDRFIALWEEFARRYKGNSAVAGYNVMNEPQTNAPRGRFRHDDEPGWDAINGLYRRVVTAIRAIDPDHIIFLEGDNFSRRFSGFELPFADNLVYSSHNYTPSGFGPGAYPGVYEGDRWDRQKQAQVFLEHEGTQFTQQHNVPLWVGEFGSVYNGGDAEIPDRLLALDDQLDVFEEYGAHWTTWTYKDVGVMGWVQLAPDSAYMQRLGDFLSAKHELKTDFWMKWLPTSTTDKLVRQLAHHVVTTLEDPDIDPAAALVYMAQASLSGYVGGLMQRPYARLFEGMSETELDAVLQSFALANCQPFPGLIEVVRKHMARPA